MAVESPNATQDYNNRQRNIWPMILAERDEESRGNHAEIEDDSEDSYSEEDSKTESTQAYCEEELEEEEEEEKQERYYEENNRLVNSYVAGMHTVAGQDRQNGCQFMPRITPTGNTELRNPTWFKEEYVFGSLQFKGQYMYDWIELPFTMDGEFDPVMLIDNAIPAMCFNRYGEYEMDYVNMKYMDSPIDGLAHYLDTPLYGADLCLIEKIILIQDNSFEIQLFIF
ncbi:hypothetical protein M422DRAFT_255905 [Sphaerobolus stellatus SS14]|uniref:Uncharacterized protein n=1 Tax=Sphaerobolus stellatus (strain SS14) TaxID=990650 RepID=A0A0C9VRT5_SPHS4|nr:hypothetical protein M422DRAFT_255905 [Sphaerobolus stellatus SS14]